MHTIKPLDEDAVRGLVGTTGAVVTVEEHSVLGGLGAAVAEVLSGEPGSPPLHRIGVPDQFPKVGSYEFVLDQCGLTDSAVAERVEAWLGQDRPLGRRTTHRPVPHDLARRIHTHEQRRTPQERLLRRSWREERRVDWDTLEYRGIEQWDSVAHMQVVAEIEDAFDIMLEIDDVIAMADFKVTKDILGKYDVSFALTCCSMGMPARTSS